MSRELKFFITALLAIFVLGLIVATAHAQSPEIKTEYVVTWTYDAWEDCSWTGLGAMTLSVHCQPNYKPSETEKSFPTQDAAVTFVSEVRVPGEECSRFSWDTIACRFRNMRDVRLQKRISQEIPLERIEGAVERKIPAKVERDVKCVRWIRAGSQDRACPLPEPDTALVLDCEDGGCWVIE